MKVVTIKLKVPKEIENIKYYDVFENIEHLNQTINTLICKQDKNKKLVCTNCNTGVYLDKQGLCPICDRKGEK